MKNPNCYMPACGIDGKECPDCANYVPPRSSLYFATKDFFHKGETYLAKNSWFTKRSGEFYLYDLINVDIPKEWLRECQNPVFPSKSALAFRLKKLYPGSQPINTLFILSKNGDKFISDFYRIGWINACLDDENLVGWREYFDQIKILWL